MFLVIFTITLFLLGSNAHSASILLAFSISTLIVEPSEEFGIKHV